MHQALVASRPKWFELDHHGLPSAQLYKVAELWRSMDLRASGSSMTTMHSHSRPLRNVQVVQT